MVQIDLNPRDYRTAAVPAGGHQKWFWWSVAIAIVLLFATSISGPTYWTVIFVAVPAFVAGKSYARWNARSDHSFFHPRGEPVLHPDALRNVLLILVLSGVAWGTAEFMNVAVRPWLYPAIKQTVAAALGQAAAPAAKDPWAVFHPVPAQ